ncbi:MAG: SPOR domain-containing protein [Duncaniella sp.]|nr:SPOR domain-containing protein [Duncaniella sp.]
MRAYLLSMIITSAAIVANADVEPTSTIVDHITIGTKNVITQPEKLAQRLFPGTEIEEVEQKEEMQRPVNGRMAGFRVQVFSDNNARTAKNEARAKQRTISSRFPQYQTYVMYTSPYWRLKVGDFRTQQEANAAADELRKAFPAYSKEIRVVRDRVNIAD